MAKERLFKINYRRKLSLDFAVLIHAGKGIYLFEGQILRVNKSYLGLRAEANTREFSSQKAGLDVVFLRRWDAFGCVGKGFGDGRFDGRNMIYAWFKTQMEEEKI